MENQFLILGHNGQIGNYLHDSFKQKKIKSAGISWSKFKKAMQAGKVYELFSSHTENNHNIVVINCLRQQHSISREKNLNDEILRALNMLCKNYQYIFLSTFEPNKDSTTRYRLYKYKIEKHISKYKNSKIIRIGRVINLTKKRKDIKEAITIYFTNMSRDIVELPFTRSEDLLNEILETKHNTQEPIKIYNGYERLCILIFSKKPYLSLGFPQKGNGANSLSITIPLPLEVLSKLCKPLSVIAFNIPFMQKLAITTQKIMSINEHQAIIKGRGFNK